MVYSFTAAFYSQRKKSQSFRDHHINDDFTSSLSKIALLVKSIKRRSETFVWKRM